MAAATAPYGHDGSMATLDDVVAHYSELDVERLHADGEALLRPLRLGPADDVHCLGHFEVVLAGFVFGERGFDDEQVNFTCECVQGVADPGVGGVNERAAVAVAQVEGEAFVGVRGVQGHSL